MTAEQKLERIKKLVKELDLAEFSKVNFYNTFGEQSVTDIRDEMWSLYCFVYDVDSTINM